jgi:hypothetical protein
MDLRLVGVSDEERARIAELAATTLNLYSHLCPGDEDRIREAVDLALAPRAEDWLRTEEEG